MPRVMKVERVSLALAKSKPPKTIVQADGRVPSSGWSNPELAPWYYIAPPADGVLDMDFVADPPSGYVLPYLAPIHASIVIDRDPADFWGKGKPLTGVRVHGATNKVTTKFDAANVVAPAGVALFDNPVPWPWGHAERAKWAKSAEGKSIDPSRSFGELLGKRLRVYRTGDVLTDDFDDGRANIEIDPKSGLIVDVWFG